MTHLSSTFKLSATSLAVTLMLAACGGGDANPPPDLIPPTVVITDSVDAAVATTDVTFTFAFSESVGSSFVADDVTVAGGTKGAFTMAGDGLSATLVVTPTADSSGTMSVNVAGGAFSDTSGNASTVAFSASQDYDTVVAPPPPPPPVDGVVLASFDESPALAFEGFNGAEGSSIAAGPDGADGLTAKILRQGGEAWAGAFVNVGPIALSATANTVSARVYSDLAGVPVVLKLEKAADPAINSGEVQAQQTVVQGWQTLTWVIPADKLGGSYDRVVMLPNLGTKASVDPGETYYFDAITLVGGTAGGGGGSFAGIFADNYVGDLFVNSKTAQGGDVGFFFDDRLPASKAYDYAGLSGFAQNPGGVPNFYFGFGLNPPAITDAFFGAFIKAPDNGEVDVSGFTNLKIAVWGPDQLFKAGAFPSLTVILQGPPVNGCGSNSGGSEIEKTFATTTQGAASVYTLPLASFTLRFACNGETSAAQVLASIAQLNVLLEGTNIQYVNKDNDGVAFTNGLNIGPVNFD